MTGTRGFDAPHPAAGRRRSRPGGSRGRRNSLDQYVELADQWWQRDGAFAALHWLAAARARLVPPATRPGAVLVDLGCGGGLLAPHLRGRGYRHVGVDRVPDSVRLAADHGLTPVVGDAYRVPLRDGCADVVVAGELLEHVAAPERVLAEAARLVRPGGLVVGDTISATALARFLLVTVSERIHGLAPPGIHDPALFVPPEVVLDGCRRRGLHAEVRGLRPAVGPLLRFVATGRGTVPMLPGSSTALLYQFRAAAARDHAVRDSEETT